MKQTYFENHHLKKNLRKNVFVKRFQIFYFPLILTAHCETVLRSLFVPKLAYLYFVSSISLVNLL